MTTVQVMLADRSYPIRIRPGSLGDLGEALSKEFESQRVVVVTSPKVSDAQFGALNTGLKRMHLSAEQLQVPDGDRAKTLRHAQKLYDGLLELGADRQTVLIGLGGGAVCDLTGFVASTFLRGVPLVQPPTTLLAQVDASVGGKTAVNHPRGKNLIGTFYQPKLVWIDPDVLATLPKRELRCGIAEVIKVAALWDADFFAWLEEHIEPVIELEREPLTHAIARAVEIKAEIVGLDERESGLRALLNFGHTLAHAIESVNGYRKIKHGEAVSIGMVFAAGVSESRAGLDATASERLEALLSRAGLATKLDDWNQQKSAYLRAMAVDKKVKAEKIGFVVLREIGRAEQISLSPEEIAAEAS